MENEENFNWVEAFIAAQEKKDTKNGKAFHILNSNNIDTNELTNHEKDKDAGVIELNYKDEKEKEMDGRSFAKGLLAFIADMPEETVKALMMAALNGTDVAANVVGVAFNAITNVDPAVGLAFKKGDLKEFKKLVNGNIQELSKYLDDQKKQVKAIGEGSELNSKAAEMLSWIVQDTPYALPIRRKLKNMGVPDYINIPLAYGIGSGIAFSDDATLFLNSEQVQNFKEMTGALPNSSEEKIFNTTYRTLEGTSLGFAIPYVFKALKFAKNTIPKYMDKQFTTAVGGAAITGSIVHGNIDKAKSEESIKTKIQKLKDASGHPDDFPSTDADFGTLSKLSSDPEHFPSTDYDYEVILGQKDKEPTTDAEIDQAFGEGSSEKAMIEATELTDANIDKIYGEGASELAMDDVLLNNKNDHNWTILNKDKETSYNQ